MNFVKFLFAIIFSFALLTACGNSDKKVGEVKTKSPGTLFEQGMNYYEKSDYESALNKFKQVKDSDSSYSKAQEMIKLADEKNKEQIKENEAKEKIRQEKYKKQAAEKDKLKSKYTKLMKSGLYQYQIEQRLQNDNFYLLSSDFEKAPDGSTGVRRRFKKDFGDYTVFIWIQNGYSLTSYYYDVSVE